MLISLGRTGEILLHSANNVDKNTPQPTVVWGPDTGVYLAEFTLADRRLFLLPPNSIGWSDSEGDSKVNLAKKEVISTSRTCAFNTERN